MIAVVDASVVVDLIAPTDFERSAAARRHLRRATHWVAPDVLPFEAFSAIRRLVLRGIRDERDAADGLDALPELPIALLETMPLLQAAWRLRNRAAAADALYLAAAQRAGAPLITSDTRLARAAEALGITVIVPTGS